MTQAGFSTQVQGKGSQSIPGGGTVHTCLGRKTKLMGKCLARGGTGGLTLGKYGNEINLKSIQTLTLTFDPAGHCFVFQ